MTRWRNKWPYIILTYTAWRPFCLTDRNHLDKCIFHISTYIQAIIGLRASEEKTFDLETKFEGDPSTLKLIYFHAWEYECQI